METRNLKIKEELNNVLFDEDDDVDVDPDNDADDDYNTSRKPTRKSKRRRKERNVSFNFCDLLIIHSLNFFLDINSYKFIDFN